MNKHFIGGIIKGFVITVSAIMAVFFSLVILANVFNFYCDTFGDKYFQDSMCFDLEFRCIVECASYNETFTHVEDGCMCQCEYGEVSYCSGFYYHFENITNNDQ